MGTNLQPFDETPSTYIPQAHQNYQDAHISDRPRTKTTPSRSPVKQTARHARRGFKQNTFSGHLRKGSLTYTPLDRRLQTVSKNVFVGGLDNMCGRRCHIFDRVVFY